MSEDFEYCVFSSKSEFDRVKKEFDKWLKKLASAPREEVMSIGWQYPYFKDAIDLDQYNRIKNNRSNPKFFSELLSVYTNHPRVNKGDLEACDCVIDELLLDNLSLFQDYAAVFLLNNQQKVRYLEARLAEKDGKNSIKFSGKSSLPMATQKRVVLELSDGYSYLSNPSRKLQVGDFEKNTLECLKIQKRDTSKLPSPTCEREDLPLEYFQAAVRFEKWRLERARFFESLAKSQIALAEKLCPDVKAECVMARELSGGSFLETLELLDIAVDKLMNRKPEDVERKNAPIPNSDFDYITDQYG